MMIRVLDAAGRSVAVYETNNSSAGWTDPYGGLFTEREISDLTDFAGGIRNALTLAGTVVDGPRLVVWLPLPAPSHGVSK